MKNEVVVFLLALPCFTGARAQATSGFGVVTGVVTQAGAEGMPEATVVLSNPTLGTQVTMITSDDGVFSAGSLLPVPGLGAGIASQGFLDGTNARRAQVAFRVSC